jgi:hypothetical protein
MIFSMKKKGPYTFSLLRLGGIMYLDMIEQFLILQLDEDDQEGHIHFQQDGAPPHYLEAVREYLNRTNFNTNKYRNYKILFPCARKHT